MSFMHRQSLSLRRLDEGNEREYQIWCSSFLIIVAALQRCTFTLNDAMVTFSLWKKKNQRTSISLSFLLSSVRDLSPQRCTFFPLNKQKTATTIGWKLHYIFFKTFRAKLNKASSGSSSSIWEAHETLNNGDASAKISRKCLLTSLLFEVESTDAITSIVVCWVSKKK